MSWYAIAIAIAASVIGYFIGAINPAALIARVRGVDIRSTGSGNPGATNTGRVLGPKWGVLVGALDIAKGLLPALAFHLFVGELAGAIAGLAAVVGHVTSPYLKGRGGKGVATTLGAILGVQPWLAVPVLIVFGITVAITRTVGIGAIAGAIALLASGVACVLLGFAVTGWFAVILAVIVLSRHRRNVIRAFRRSTGESFDDPQA